MEKTRDDRSAVKQGRPGTPIDEFAKQTVLIVETYLNLRDAMEGPEDLVRLR